MTRTPRLRTASLAALVLLTASGPMAAFAQDAEPASASSPAPAPAPAPAQPSSRSAGGLDPLRATMLRNRYHVRQMESVLVRAVEHAAEVMSHRLTSVSPDVMALAGTPRAQGFRIEGHGLFFSVEVPRLSDSMAWALQVLNANRDQRTLVSLHRLAETQTDPVVRADIERAIRLLNRHMTMPTMIEAVRPTGAPGAAAGPGLAADAAGAPAAQAQGVGQSAVTAATVAPDGDAPAPSDDIRALLANPSAAYEDEVKRALVDALLDYALTLPLSPGEKVTVAARDAGYIAFPDAVSEMVTVTLTADVDDLLAFRQQRIDRDEARRRVRVREF